MQERLVEEVDFASVDLESAPADYGTVVGENGAFNADKCTSLNEHRATRLCVVVVQRTLDDNEARRTHGDPSPEMIAQCCSKKKYDASNDRQSPFPIIRVEVPSRSSLIFGASSCGSFDAAVADPEFATVDLQSSHETDAGDVDTWRSI
jgi:hypothetical protein|eukprot:1732920-Prymnesium_polylepis.2